MFGRCILAVYVGLIVAQENRHSQERPAEPEETDEDYADEYGGTASSKNPFLPRHRSCLAAFISLNPLCRRTRPMGNIHMQIIQRSSRYGRQKLWQRFRFV
jgi:hypothetical protein